MPSNIAVSDPYGHLVAFARMDGAVLVSIEVAQKKARTVAMFGGRFKSGDLYNGEFPSTFFVPKWSGDDGDDGSGVVG